MPLFEIGRLAPGVVVFGLSFMTLFSATLLAKDRGSAFLQRLYTTPLTAGDFILGYLLPVLPVCVAQSVVCFATAALLGLHVTVHVLAAVLFTLPVALLFVSLGLLCGSVDGVALGRLVRPRAGRRRVSENRKSAALRPCRGVRAGGAARGLRGDFPAPLVCDGLRCRRDGSGDLRLFAADETAVSAATAPGVLRKR